MAKLELSQTNKIENVEETIEVMDKSSFKYFFKCLLHSKSALFGLTIIFILVFCAIFAPFLAPNDPAEIDITRGLRPPSWENGGTMEFPLGTDSLGRCVASRLIYGARVSLIVGFTAVFISGAIGITLGLTAGYFGGIVDDVIMRLADITMAFPFILLAIAVMAVLGPGLFNIIFVLGITGWVTYGRVVRAEVLSYREKEFVEAAVALGYSSPRIIFKHIFPNVVSAIIVIASFSIASTIISEASLSFLGLGVQPSIPSWGAMISDAREYIYRAWWLAVFPGLAIVFTVLGINIFGDWLRDFLDPRIQNF